VKVMNDYDVNITKRIGVLYHSITLNFVIGHKNGDNVMSDHD
jgi:hypothetical protein